MLRWFLWGKGFMIVDVWTLGPLETSAGVAVENNFENPPPHYRISTGDRPEIECCCIPSPKQTNRPLKSYLAPKRDRIVFQPPDFCRGWNAPINFRGLWWLFCYVLFFSGKLQVRMFSWNPWSRVCLRHWNGSILTQRNFSRMTSARFEWKRHRCWSSRSQVFHLIAWQVKKVWSLR